jgi:hypothetical protein
MAEELGEYLKTDSKVYFAGYKCFKDDTRALTCYCPKSILLEKGYKDAIAFNFAMIDKVNKMNEEDLNELYMELKTVKKFEEIDGEGINGES